MLINIVLPHELDEIIKSNAEMYRDISEKPAMGAVRLDKHTQYRTDNYGCTHNKPQDVSTEQGAADERTLSSTTS